jgi:phage-related protein
MSYDLGEAHGKIVLDYNGEKAISKAENDIDKLYRKAKLTDRDLGKLGKTLRGLGKGVAFTGIAVSLTNAATQAAALGIQLLGMVPQLASIGSLAAGLPAVLAGGVAAVGVLKAAFVGVGDAVTAALDPAKADKFDEAIKNLSPSAQAFAKAVQGSSKNLQDFQKGLQEAFFKSGDFAGLVPKITGALDQLRPSLEGIATDFGRMGREVVQFGTSQKAVGFISSSLVEFRKALLLAQPAIKPILNGLLDVGKVGQPLLNRLGSAVGKVGTQFGNWLSQVSSDGRLQEWINTALDTLKTLGSIAKNVGSILNSIFSTAAATGGGLLNTIKTITGQFATFLNSAEGKAAITSLFTSIMETAKALAPVFTTLAGALAGALGPALAQIATEVGPVLLQVVQALAPAFGPLAQAIADVLSAVAPLAPPLAELVSQFVQLAGPGLSALAQALTPIIPLIGSALSGALTALAPVLTQLITYFPQFAAAGLQIAQALLPLVPAVVQFANALTQALLPYLPQLMEAFLQLVPPLVQLATIMGGQLASALVAIIPYLPQIIGFLVGMQTTILTMVQAGLQFLNFLLQLGQGLMNLPSVISGAISAFASAISGGFTTAYNFVVTLGGQILAWFVALPGRIGGFLAALPGVIGGLISSAVQEMAFRFGQGIGIVISQAVAFPGRVRSAASALIGQLSSLASSAWSAAKGAFSSGVSGAVGIAKSLPGRARAAISALGGLLSGLARSAWAALKSAFSGGVSNAAGVAHSLPGRIRSAVGNLGSLLVGAGRDAVMGLVNGIRGAIGAAVSAAASVGKSVISGIKSTLKISSPSRVMITLGRYVVQGLQKGLLGSASQVQSAANKLANMVKDAFSDKLIKRGQRNSVLKTLSAGTKQLLTLVNRANTVAAKLKTAQDNLKKAQDAYNTAFNDAKKSVSGAFDLVTPGQGFVDLNQTKDRFKDTVSAAKQFAKDIQTLTKRGLNKALLQQLLDAGVEGGATMARALATASQKDINDFNNLQKQLDSSANSVGKTVADKFYGAGLKAAQGLVNGLNSQAKAIDKQAERIANSMIKAIKKALKIKSPSRITFGVGRFTTQGLIDGLKSLRTQVERAAKSLAESAVAPTLALGAPSTVPAAARTFPVASSNPASPASVQQNVYALPGMSAKQVADYGLTKLTLALTTGVGATALPAPATQGVA